ncbi:YhgE/Pip domain-containing protein [Tumebacillus sp. ITR2]|uniref:YhgE/Pip domain-containing protein n=1 Tax=Tumebacillus amylolyticus TaxID=2801339 RepID=A0ABS1J967_9BACL|nr:YhgE/Pip domain-containing protein [Tumebacillus amylolyticus]MBL0386188.1 YhgE/Pip domain-containing protein [Tumebacillus amylolyticus]
MNTFWIFRTEMRRLLRSRLGRAAMVVGIIIPLLYSGLYLYAFWDPYNQMENYPVALVNLDHGGEKDGKHVDYGKELADELVKDNAVGWKVVSEEEANKGLEGEGYYLKVTIPATFTEDALSVTGDQPKQAVVQFTQNEGKNYIASTISKRLETSLREEVGNKFSKEYFTGIFDVIGDAGDGLSKAADGANQLATGASDLNTGAAKLADGANQVHTGTVQAADGSKKLADGAAQASDGAAQVASGSQLLNDGLKQANGGATKLQAGADTIQAKLGDLSQGAQKMAPGLQTANDNLTKIQAGLSKAAGQTGDLQAGLQQMQGYLGTVDANGNLSGSNESALNLLASLANQYGFASDPRYAGAVKAIGGVSSKLGTTSATVGQSKTQLDAAAGGLGQIAEGQKQLIAGLGQISDGSKQLQAGAGDLSKGLHDLQAGTATMADKSGELAAGAKKVADGNAALATGSRDLASGTGQLVTGTSQLADGTKQLNEGTQKLSDGSKELAGKLTDATKDSTISNPDVKADVMSNPVKVESTPIHPVSTYGMGFASYFIPLSLWVGAVVLFFMLSMKEFRWMMAPVSSTSFVLGKFLTLGVVGILSTVVSGLVLTQGLGLQVLHPVEFYAIMVLLSFESIAIIGFLIARLGSGAGRFLAILILILQLTSSAGTFPIELVPNFFKAIHPYLPMSYGIEGLRAIIATGDQALVQKDMLILAGITVVVLILHILTTRRTLKVSDLHDKDVLAG